MSSGTSAGSGAAIRQEWWVVDATNKVLGRLATRVARVLCGKHRPRYLPYQDTGDFVVVTNADKILLTGNKGEDKFEAAVRGMLPKSKLGRKQLKKLKVYRGSSHPHEAQRPRVLTLPVRRAAS